MTRCSAYIVRGLLQCYLRDGHDGSHMAHHDSSGHDYSRSDEWRAWGREPSEGRHLG